MSTYKNGIDPEKRPQGKYIKKYFITVQDIKSEITETIIIGREYKIMSFQKEYNPPIPYIPEM